MNARTDKLFDVSGKVIVITGAGGILYGAIGKALAASGAKVALLDILGDKATNLAKEIVADGGEAIGVTCNVLELDSVEAALAAVLEEFGCCDAIINGAGGNRKGACVPPDGDFTTLSLDELEKVFELNYKGTVLPSQVFCRHFAKAGKGIVINTSSMCALSPLTNVVGYSNAKAAVTNFTQWLAVQVKVDFPRANIRVNEIAPGFFDTNQNHRLLFEEDDKTLTSRGHSIIANTPQGRFGNPDELLGPILLLLSDAGSFIQGTTIPIDGGFNVYSGVGPLDDKA
ncbi:MAG: SDR family oxidoreductase [Kiritimatiellia bacterium]|jgi:NAD(P)-dependent dehydrogenase (short-subunit alcohol dehydrogenase family)|nr:SDR family oxidoreductase [Kiritimatiellia bacterium]MDP6848282.1 SDR family oxidoreductase [Kiritimatiellia bacterium]